MTGKGMGRDRENSFFFSMKPWAHSFCLTLRLMLQANTRPAEPPLSLPPSHRLIFPLLVPDADTVGGQ